jgi:hypothetical protein
MIRQALDELAAAEGWEDDPIAIAHARHHLDRIDHQLALTARALGTERNPAPQPGEHPDELDALDAVAAGRAEPVETYLITDQRDPPTALAPLAEDLGALARACALVARREGPGRYAVHSTRARGAGGPWGTLTVTAERWTMDAEGITIGPGSMIARPRATTPPAGGTGPGARRREPPRRDEGDTPATPP